MSKHDDKEIVYIEFAKGNNIANFINNRGDKYLTNRYET